jgi:hypothetical protein
MDLLDDFDARLGEIRKELAGALAEATAALNAAFADFHARADKAIVAFNLGAIACQNTFEAEWAKRRAIVLGEAEPPPKREPPPDPDAEARARADAAEAGETRALAATLAPAPRALAAE